MKNSPVNRILLLEDDLSLIDGLSFALEKQGWAVSVARCVRDADLLWKAETFNLLILDVSLPDGSGFDFCKRVRSMSEVPVIFLTASDEETSVVMGLDIGGDDYVTKPFKLGILISRVNALLRRAKLSRTDCEILVSNGVEVSLTQGQAALNGKNLELTSAEYRLLVYFMQNINVILSKDNIYEHLWDNSGNYVDDNTLSVYIRRLRLKVEDNPDEPKRIVTVRGLGYKWSVT